MKSQKKQQTKQVLMNAAKEIVLKEGHNAITVRRIADLTGYSYPNLYYYFKDINTLLWELRLDMIEDIINEFSSNDFSYEDPVEEIIHIFKTYTDYYFKHPNIFRFFYFYPFAMPENDMSYHNLELRFNGLWHSSFHRLIKNSIIAEPDIETVAKTIIYSLHGMIMLRLSSNGTMKQEDINIELERLINYLLKR